MNIVGEITKSSDNVERKEPVIWADADSPPKYLSLGGEQGGVAYGINSLGQIVGEIGNYDEFNPNTIPVIWADADSPPRTLRLPGTVTSGVARGINSLGQIVGSNVIDEVNKPVIWADADSPPRTLRLPGTVTSGVAFGINSLGQIVGSIVIDEVNKPVIWADADSPPRTLRLPGTVTSGVARGINSLGQIVGNNTITTDTTSGAGAVIWADSISLPTLLSLQGFFRFNTASNINSLGQIVGTNTYVGDLPGPAFWLNSTAQPQKLSLGGNMLGGAHGISDIATPMPTPMPTPTPTPVISNICFPAGTPITTDQGRIAIESIDPQLHTINHQPILHVTRTVTLDKYLISLAPHALGRNVPHTKTLLSKDHKIAFKGQLVPAYRFLDYSDQVKKVTYNGETLYNILLPSYSTMLINNLECETLHPENIIAKLYTASYTDTERADLAQEWNESLTQRDKSAYQAVINRLTAQSYNQL